VFKPADILIIRSGWVKWYNEASEEERVRGARDGHEFVGVQGSKESVEWLWEKHFAAVAGDAIAFEAWPPRAPYRMSFFLSLLYYFSCFVCVIVGVGVRWERLICIGLHDHFLAMWGTPIGELWNLEQLAEVCKKENKYSFFLTSAPLNVHGGIASPPNALVIL
jgi:hypothetical protein